MKLYTEEQLFNTVNAIRYYEEVYDEKIAEERIEKHLKALTPIELPSDEQIENAAKEYANEGCISDRKDYGICVYDFKIGGKWVVDNIKNTKSISYE